MSEPSTAQDWIAHKGKAAKLGLTLRQTILNILPDITETLDLKAAMVSYGIGDRYEDTVVIIRSDGPIWSLGFYRGRELPDPNRLLSGNGRLHAAVNIAGRADVESEALKTLIIAAYEAALERKKDTEEAGT
ncbi:MAG: hypothetical protein ABR986_11585 [Methanomassiliicoccales archaeon]|jgi:hypothetical protein